MRPRIAIFMFAALLCSTLSAHATIVTYSYTTEFDPRPGSFSYDDTTTTTVPSPSYAVAGGTWYQAISFIDNGIAVANPLIGVYWNVPLYGGPDLFDAISVASDSLTDAVLTLVNLNPPTLFSGEQLNQLDGRSLSDFSYGADVISVSPTREDVPLLTLTAVCSDVTGHPVPCPGPPTPSIPEPATLSLLGLGLATIEFMRRRTAR